jgi:hypothetical protein
VFVQVAEYFFDSSASSEDHLSAPAAYYTTGAMIPVDDVAISSI